MLGRSPSPIRTHASKLTIKEPVPMFSNHKKHRPKSSAPCKPKPDFFQGNFKNKYVIPDICEYDGKKYAYGERIVLVPLTDLKLPDQEFSIKMNLKCEYGPKCKVSVIGSLPSLGYFQKEKVFLTHM